MAKTLVDYSVKPLLVYSLVAFSLNASYGQKPKPQKLKKPSLVETLVVQYLGKQPNIEEHIYEAKTKTAKLKKDCMFFPAKVRLAYVFGGDKGARKAIEKAVDNYKLHGAEKKYMKESKKRVRKSTRKVQKRYGQ